MNCNSERFSRSLLRGASIPFIDNLFIKNSPAPELINISQFYGKLNGLKLLERQGYALLKHGIGIHSGSVVDANIGCSERLSYGLVGDTVNLASRIQGLTKTFNTDIIVSVQTRARLDNKFEVMKLPATFVKGKYSPAEIYKVL